QDTTGTGNNFSNNIKIVASADGGNTFTTQKYVSLGSLGRPQLVISQGTAAPGAAHPSPGQVTLIYTDALGSIDAARIQDGGYGAYGENTRLVMIPEAQGGTFNYNTPSSTAINPSTVSGGRTIVPFAPNVPYDTM